MRTPARRDDAADTRTPLSPKVPSRQKRLDQAAGGRSGKAGEWAVLGSNQ